MNDLYDPVKLLRLISGGAVEDLLNSNEPRTTSEPKLSQLAELLTGEPADEKTPDDDFAYLRSRLDDLEEKLRQRNRRVEREAVPQFWNEDENAPGNIGSVEWSPLQQELRLLAAGRSTAGKFLVLNETQKTREVWFDCHPPADAGAIGWQRALVRFTPDRFVLSPHRQELVTLSLEFPVEMSGTVDFSVDVRDVDRTLMSKLWVSVRFAEISS